MKVSNPTDVLNDLLQGELSASETYAQAIQKADDPGSQEALRRIQTDHDHAAALLRGRIEKNGGIPASGSGAWGAFARAVQGGAQTFGMRAALATLKEGEESGLSGYEEALDDEDLDAESRLAISNDLAPLCRLHIDSLDRLIAGGAAE